MRRPLIAVASLMCALFVALSIAHAQQGRGHGSVVSTKLTACDMKPGSGEGTMTLDAKGATPGHVTIKIQNAR